MNVDIDRLAEYAETTKLPAAQILTGILKPGSYSGLRYALNIYRRSSVGWIWKDFPEEIDNQASSNSEISGVLAPLYQSHEEVVKTTNQRLTGTDTNLPEIRLLSRMIYSELNGKADKEIPPSPLAAQTSAFSRIQRTYGTAAAIEGLSQPQSLLKPPGQNEFLQDAYSAKEAYPRELARAELYGERKPEDKDSSHQRLRGYVKRLEGIGVEITKRTLEESEGLVGGYTISSIDSDDVESDTALPYYPNIAEGTMSLEDGVFLLDANLDNGERGRISLKKSGGKSIHDYINSINYFANRLIEDGKSPERVFSADNIKRFDELSYRFTTVFFIGGAVNFINNYFLEGDPSPDWLIHVSNNLRDVADNPADFFSKEAKPRSFVNAWRNDPIAAAIGYQIANNPGFIEQADLLGADAPSLIPAVNSFRREGRRYSGEGSSGITFGGKSEQVKNNSQHEIEEEEAETLFVITGPAKEVAKIKSLEYPVLGHDFGDFKEVEPSGKTEGAVTIRINDLVKKPNGPYWTFLPTPMNSELADLKITSYRDNSNEPLIPERGWHYEAEQSSQGFMRVNNLWGDSIVSYSVSIEDKPQEELPSDLQRLKHKTVKEISNRLRLVGYTALADSVEGFLKKNKRMGLYDLADCIKGAADYSFDGKEADFRYIDGFEDLVNPKTGRLQYQCDGARALTAYIMRYYLAETGLRDKYQIIPTTLFPVDGSTKTSTDESGNATLVVSKAGHARVHITDGKNTVAILDTTPKIPQLEVKNMGDINSLKTTEQNGAVAASVETAPDLTELKSAIDKFSKDSGVRGVFGGISDMQMRYFADTPLFQIPKLAIDLIASHEGSPDNLRRSLVDMEQRFDGVSESFMKFLDPEFNDQRMKILANGQVRGALFEILQEIRKVI